MSGAAGYLILKCLWDTKCPSRAGELTSCVHKTKEMTQKPRKTSGSERSPATDSRGKQIAHDARFRRLGEYDPDSDLTRDSSFRRVGTGNQLAALIWRAQM